MEAVHKRVCCVIRQKQNNNLQSNLASCLQDGSSTPFEVKDSDDFQKRVLAATKPVLVDFHADWCTPCKALTPKLDAIVGEKDGLLELAKVDVDQNPDLAMQYEVRGIPTVLAIKNGKVVDNFTGLIEKEQLRQFVENLLK
ncbi:hypothetical protein ACROYT_G008398 [Oculina patagonica]